MSLTNASPRGTPRLALILAAAGSSTRMGGGVHKPLIQLRGLPVMCHTLKRFQGIRGLEQVVIVAHPEDLPEIEASYWPQLQDFGATELVSGGNRRQDSVARGLRALQRGIEVVLIHDAVRPLVSRRAVEESISAAARHGAAIVAVPVADTLKRTRGGNAIETVPRGDLWVAQTPQTFQTTLIRRAFAEAEKADIDCTDDAQLVERLGVQVKLVRGSWKNFKITTPEQLRMAEALLARSEPA